MVGARRAAVLTCVFLLVVASHWFACMIALTASLHDSADETWLGANIYGLCGPVHELVDQNVANCPNLSVGKFYVDAFSWSVLVIVGAGGTDACAFTRPRAESRDAHPRSSLMRPAPCVPPLVEKAHAVRTLHRSAAAHRHNARGRTH